VKPLLDKFGREISIAPQGYSRMLESASASDSPYLRISSQVPVPNTIPNSILCRWIKELRSKIGHSKTAQNRQIRLIRIN
jgi:hypothetical protein